MTGIQEHKATLLNNFGIVNLNLGNYEMAVECLEMSLKLLERHHFGELPPDVGMGLMNLALCYRRQGKNDQAKATYDRYVDCTANAA
jgi:Tfp pilus assembly protein PilF